MVATTCPHCECPMEFCPADSDDSGPGGSVATLPACWCCVECDVVLAAEKRERARDDD